MTAGKNTHKPTHSLIWAWGIQREGYDGSYPTSEQRQGRMTHRSTLSSIISNSSVMSNLCMAISQLWLSMYHIQGEKMLPQTLAWAYTMGKIRIFIIVLTRQSMRNTKHVLRAVSFCNVRSSQRKHRFFHIHVLSSAQTLTTSYFNMLLRLWH